MFCFRLSPEVSCHGSAYMKVRLHFALKTSNLANKVPGLKRNRKLLKLQHVWSWYSSNTFVFSSHYVSHSWYTDWVASSQWLQMSRQLFRARPSATSMVLPHKGHICVPHMSYIGWWATRWFLSQLFTDRNVVILTTFASLAAVQVVILTTSGATSDENFIKTTIFLFQCYWWVHNLRAIMSYAFCC